MGSRAAGERQRVFASEGPPAGPYPVGLIWCVVPYMLYGVKYIASEGPPAGPYPAGLICCVVPYKTYGVKYIGLESLLSYKGRWAGPSILIITPLNLCVFLKGRNCFWKNGVPRWICIVFALHVHCIRRPWRTRRGCSSHLAAKRASARYYLIIIGNGRLQGAAPFPTTFHIIIISYYSYFLLLLFPIILISYYSYFLLLLWGSFTSQGWASVQLPQNIANAGIPD